MKIVATQRVKNMHLVESWAAASGWTFSQIDGTKPIARILAGIGRVDRLILANHPLDREDDRELLDQFAAALKDGPIYYSPRPNMYVDVADYALFGAPAAALEAFAPENVPVGARILEFARDVYGHLPASVRAAARPLVREVHRVAWRYAAADGGSSAIAASATNADVKIGTLEPEEKIPSGLANLPFKPRDWSPTTPLLRRDLLDRVEAFFPFPRGIHVVTLNKCNLACVMCPYHSPKYKSHHTSGYFDEYRSMSMETFRRIADYAGRNGISLQFGQIEEPLMHKRIFEFISYARQAGVPNIHMSTNGTFMTKEKADILLETGITSVMFSIDATSPETYKEIRGSDLENLEANARYFIQRAREKGIKTWASFILQNQPDGEREAFLQKWRKIGVTYVTFYVLTDHDPKTGKFIRTEEFREKGDRYPCASPWLQSVAFPDGEISLCCKTMTDVGWRGVVSVGSLKDTEFERIWTSEKYRKVRDELIKGHFEEFQVCADCEIWSASTQAVEVGEGYVRTFNETMSTYQFTDADTR